MIPAWQVYLVLQADSVVMMLFVIAVLFLLTSIAFAVSEEDINLNPPAKRFFAASTFVFFLWGLCPGSKTLAAMTVIPFIASTQVIDTVTPELKELYQLSKEALKRVTTPPPPPAEAPKQE